MMSSIDERNWERCSCTRQVTSCRLSSNHCNYISTFHHSGQLPVEDSQLCATDVDNGLCGLLNECTLLSDWLLHRHAGQCSGNSAQKDCQEHSHISSLCFYVSFLLPTTMNSMQFCTTKHAYNVLGPCFFFEVSMNNVRPIYRGS